MFLGVDLGGTNIAVGITDDTGRLLARHACPTGVGRSAGEILSDLKNACITVCQKLGIACKDIRSIGVGVPGTIDKKRLTLVFGTNLFLENICFSDVFRPEFACPVFLENDANCAALGEYYGGAGEGISDLVMITLGTGVGGGIIINGEIYSGFNDIAGEIGHMVIQVGGYPCNCGRRGCFEAYASTNAFIRMAEETMAHNPESILHVKAATSGGKLDGLAIFAAIDAGDETARVVFNQYLRYLACGINNVISILQPEKLVIGGGIAGQGDRLLIPLRALVERDLIKASCPQTQVLLAKAGNDAGIIGAAMLRQ